MGKRRKFTSEFKVKIMLEMLREERALGDLVRVYEVSPNQLARWRSELLERVPQLFDDPKAERGRRKTEQAAAEERERLLKAIGQLTMERDYLQAAQAR